MGKSILIIEDEAKIVRTLRLYLEQAGYSVVPAADGAQGLAAFRHAEPALVLLDLNLPGSLDGLDVCRIIRKESQVPVIMLTARGEENDRIAGLEIGADDYIPKPFSPREVVARIRAVLRRTQVTDEVSQIVEAAGIRLDLDRRTALLNGTEIELTSAEFDLLAVLMRHPGRVFTRAQLLDATRGEAYEGFERSVDQHIKNLRQKLERDPRHPRYILTVYGAGYKFAREDT